MLYKKKVATCQKRPGVLLGWGWGFPEGLNLLAVVFRGWWEGEGLEA